jgi:nucleotide-binding universal stress UspA family protein
MASVTRIIYASDFSRASLVAFPHALRLAKALDAELAILHVLPSPAAPFIEGGYVPQQVWDDMYAGMRAAATRHLDPLLTKAAEAGVRATPVVLDSGAPAEDIVRTAQETKADMLVLGTHGRTGIAKFFLGSVAARVVATATCPVLTVRAPETD